jgi:hypothetical protein
MVRAIGLPRVQKRGEAQRLQSCIAAPGEMPAAKIRMRPGHSVRGSQSMATDLLSGCVIVSGMPAAGKTTVTKLAAGLLPRAARIGADDMHEMILGGRVGYLCEPAEEALRQEELCNRNYASWRTTSSTSGSRC